MLDLLGENFWQPFAIKYLVVVAILLILIYKWSSTSTNSSPPSPPKLPIVGNLHQLGLYLHRSLKTLAQLHGPFMLLHFGSVPILVVSSDEGAREIMKTHDIMKICYNMKDVAFAPYGEYWRQIKSICVLNLLSNKRVRSFRAVRAEETKSMIRNITKQCSISSSTSSASTASEAFNLSEILLTLSSDVICRVALGRKYSDDGESGKTSGELSELMSCIYIGDYIPWLAWFARLNGLDAKFDSLAKRFDEFLETVVQEHMVDPRVKNEDQKDLVDVLLGLQKERLADSPMDAISIKATILDMFIAGSDTTFLEWTMSELLRHPRIMEKLQNEVRGIVGKETEITEDHLAGMNYLKAVIKETLRLHPPVPLLLPRLSTQDVKINGHNIKANTQAIVNAWQIGRDPKSHDRPEEYEPERFVNSIVEYKENDFNYIPFVSW